MQKWLKVALITAGSIVVLIVLLWLGLAFYINKNKASLLSEITQQLNEKINGTLTVADMEPALVRSFPDISLALREVRVQDSLFSQHHHALLSVKNIFVKVNTLSLLSKHVDIREISLEEGTVYLYTDTTGYTNTNLFKQKNESTGNSSGRDAAINRLRLENISFVLDNQQKGKLFNLDIKSLKGKIAARDTGYVIDMRSDILVKSFSFNTERGSYIKDKTMEMDWKVHFNKLKKVLYIPSQKIEIGGQSLNLGADFNFSDPAPEFALHIVANEILFREAASFLLPGTAEKLKPYDIKQPMEVVGEIKGSLLPHSTPRINVNWIVKNNTLVAHMVTLDSCSFTGGYNNEVVPGMGLTDENSAINIYLLNGKWFEIPVFADTMRVLNLKYPEMTARFRSDFPISRLNSLTDESTFLFKEGTAKANLYYKGGLTANDTILPFIEGTVEVKRGELTYVPRGLSFHNCSALLDFTGKDLYLKNINIQSAKSTLMMDGSIRNLMNLYFSAPNKILIDWVIRSPLVDLNEFRSFLIPRKQVKKSSASIKKNISRAAQQLDVVLNASSASMQVQLAKVNFQRFSAQNVVANIVLMQSGIQLNKIALQHAGGSLQVNGNMVQQGNNNKFKINVGINNVHIDQLFYAFDNFGMQTLTSKNLKGILNANAAITGNIFDNGSLAPGSLYGTLRFDLKKGALVHFAPLEEIGNFVFRKRNLADITFDNLQNTLQLQGAKIIIPPMRIASSALNIDVGGVYGIDKGTNINLDIPLRNPQKDSLITDKKEKRRRSNKGIVLHLRAVDDNGKVKIKLGSGKKED
jgi:hypothetical protein